MAASTTNPVAGWNLLTWAALESTFGTVPAPNAVSPNNWQFLYWTDLDMGPVEQQDTRATKDRTVGRDMTAQFVSGRVKLMSFKGKTAVKSRSAVDTVPVESQLYQAGGMVQTVNTGTSVVYSFSSAPTLQGLSLFAGYGATPYLAEQGFGAAVEELTWSGGDHEVQLEVGGKFAGKYWLGQCSATTASTSATAITVDNAGDEYKLSVGWYAWESETIYVSAVQYGSGTFTCTRGALGSTAATHTAKNLTPYSPATATPSGPISEANSTIQIDSISTRCTKWSLKLKTGMMHLPGESGSLRVQGLKVVRFDIAAEVEFVVTDDKVLDLGKMNQRKTVAVSLAQGSGAGQVLTWSLPTCVIKPISIPTKDNDVPIAKVAFLARGNSGNDMGTLTLT